MKLYWYKGEDTYLLRKVDVSTLEINTPTIPYKRVAFLDVETTGLDKGTDEIIELGVRVAYVSEAGDIYGLSKEQQDIISCFNEPVKPISKEITRITGITQEMVKGHTLEIEKLQHILETVDLVVAHNAGFDRPFIDRQCTASKNVMWADSFTQKDWVSEGYSKANLEFLLISHGIIASSHRALADVESMIFLLMLDSENTGECYFREIWRNAFKPSLRLYAWGFPFASKDELKNRNFRWDVGKRVWYKDLTGTEEVKTLTEEITPFKGYEEIEVVEIEPLKRFSHE